MDRNDKVFTLLYKIVMHKKVAHPYEIQNKNLLRTVIIWNNKVIKYITIYIYIFNK